jgi:hypothetical protein
LTAENEEHCGLALYVEDGMHMDTYFRKSINYFIKMQSFYLFSEDCRHVLAETPFWGNSSLMLIGMYYRLLLEYGRLQPLDHIQDYWGIASLRKLLTFTPAYNNKTTRGF